MLFAGRDPKYFLPILGSGLGCKCVSKTLYSSVTKCGKILRVDMVLPLHIGLTSELVPVLSIYQV